MDNGSVAEMLAASRQAYMISPAGFGKTETITMSVAIEHGRQLILTHTHAGVHALRSRLRKREVSPSKYEVETIAGYALKYAAAYQSVSGLSELRPCGSGWNHVYDAASLVLHRPIVQDVIRSSYSGLYVDEYQDCMAKQHNVIMAIAKIIPCRVVGDPLQGIFDFDKANPMIDWCTQVYPDFEEIPSPSIPWRWQANPEMGEWLSVVRGRLIAGTAIDLTNTPSCVRWVEFSRDGQREACFQAAKKPGSVVAIRKWPNLCHEVAQSLCGVFTSMEEMDCKDLLGWCDVIERADGCERAVAVIKFASDCMTVVSTVLRKARRRLENGDLPKPEDQAGLEVAAALTTLASSDDLKPLLPALKAIEALPGKVVFRRELWGEMIRAVQEYHSGSYSSLREAAWSVRNRARILGRSVEYRTVSRTLLVKGLEFDNVIVLNADELDAKNLYVALTRASRCITVLSARPVIQKADPGIVLSQAGS